MRFHFATSTTAPRWEGWRPSPQVRPALQHGESRPPAAPAQHQVNSQDLQVAQGSEGSIFDAADLVVVQLPAERKGEDEGWLVRAELPRSARSGASLSPRCPSTPSQRLLATRRRAARLPRCSGSARCCLTALHATAH